MITPITTTFKRRSLSPKGFTLVELLVVIAIIGILASIVVPNVTGFLNKGQVTKVVAEIRSVDTALLGILGDTNRSSFRDLLKPDVRDQLDGYASLPSTVDRFNAAQGFYQEMFYNLLRQGKNSDWAKDNLKPELRQKLGNSYMELGQDSWGQNYRFWMGPLRIGEMPFRSFRIIDGARDLDDVDFSYDPPDGPNNDVYVYTSARQGTENEKIPGAPRFDDLPGFPAPKDRPVYVYSLGKNNLVDAHFRIQEVYATGDFAFYGGGDDINNWDNAQGWDNAPK